MLSISYSVAQWPSEAMAVCGWCSGKCRCLKTLFINTIFSFSASLVLDVQWLTTIQGWFWTFHTLSKPVKHSAQTDKCVLLQRWQHYIFLHWDEKLPCGVLENFQLESLMEINPPEATKKRFTEAKKKTVLLIPLNCSLCNRASLQMCVSSLKS